MNKKEEITDLIRPEAFDDPNFKKGLALVMEKATIKITKIDRKNKRVWGEHIVLMDQKTTLSHYGHNVDTTQETPFCTDCEVPVDQPSTEDGEVKYADRRDRTLEDGTIIE